MLQATMRVSVAMSLVAGRMISSAQTPPSAGAPAAFSRAPSTATSPGVPDQIVTGGKLHGLVKSGNIPLPGVTVTAQNTLTGKRYSTTTDVTGGWSLTIPQNGRYVIRTQFAAFAQGAQEAVLNAANHDQSVNFSLMLASRAAQQEQQQEGQSTQVAQAIRQLAGNGAQSLSLMNALTSDTETQGGNAGASGAALPSAAGNSDFSSDSVAISGQAGAVSPLAGVDMDRLRDADPDFSSAESRTGRGHCWSDGRFVWWRGRPRRLRRGWFWWAWWLWWRRGIRWRSGRIWRWWAREFSAASIPVNRMARSSGTAATLR